MSTTFHIRRTGVYNDEQLIKAAVDWVVKQPESLAVIGTPQDFRMLSFDHDTQDDEHACELLVVQGHSTQGVEFAHERGGVHRVTVRDFASQLDWLLAYGLLHAFDTLHPGCWISSGMHNQRAVLGAGQAAEHWRQARASMERLCASPGTQLMLQGGSRSFFFDAARYAHLPTVADQAQEAWEEFVRLQWHVLDDGIATPIEWREVVPGELNTVQVFNNEYAAYIADCQYVGLLNTHTNQCKLLPREQAYVLLGRYGAVETLDAVQAAVSMMPAEQWDELWRDAPGILVEQYRKTYVLRWNTDVSNFSMADFEKDVMQHSTDMSWSVYDHEQAHFGDRFVMVRTGEGRHGIVATGYLTTEPFTASNWRGEGDPVHYSYLGFTAMFHPERSPYIITTQGLANAIPDFDWERGHSGEVLDERQAAALHQLWRSFVNYVSGEVSADGSYPSTAGVMRILELDRKLGYDEDAGNPSDDWDEE